MYDASEFKKCICSYVFIHIYERTKLKRNTLKIIMAKQWTFFRIIHPKQLTQTTKVSKLLNSEKDAKCVLIDWETESNIVKNFKPFWVCEIILVSWLFAIIVYVKGSSIIYLWPLSNISVDRGPVEKISKLYQDS